MTNYQLGKVYKIYSPSNPSLTYVGSTVQVLSKRFGGHKKDYKRYLNGQHPYMSSFQIFQEADDYKIELIENVPCETKEQLLRAEGQYIRNMECLNRKIAGRTDKEYWTDNRDRILKHKKIYNKQYRQENKHEIDEKQKIYVNNNKEKIKERRKNYYDNNKQIIIDKRKQYYENNKEKIKKYASRPYTCVCGKTIQLQEKPRHSRSQTHTDFILDDPLYHIASLYDEH
jgi:RNA binding exosome subunit